MSTFIQQWQGHLREAKIPHDHWSQNQTWELSGDTWCCVLSNLGTKSLCSASQVCRHLCSVLDVLFKATYQELFPVDFQKPITGEEPLFCFFYDTSWRQALSLRFEEKSLVQVMWIERKQNLSHIPGLWPLKHPELLPLIQFPPPDDLRNWQYFYPQDTFPCQKYLSCYEWEDPSLVENFHWDRHSCETSRFFTESVGFPAIFLDAIFLYCFFDTSTTESILISTTSSPFKEGFHQDETPSKFFSLFPHLVDLEDYTGKKRGFPFFLGKFCARRLQHILFMPFDAEWGIRISSSGGRVELSFWGYDCIYFFNQFFSENEALTQNFKNFEKYEGEGNVGLPEIGLFQFSTKLFFDQGVLLDRIKNARHFGSESRALLARKSKSTEKPKFTNPKKI